MKSDAKIIPKCFNVFTLSRLQSNIGTDMEEISANFLWLPINMDLVLERLSVSLLALSHKVTL